jgi:hypothetical protein
MPGREATLMDAWPWAAWRVALQATEPDPEPPASVVGMLQGRLGDGWQARAWGVLGSLEAARFEFKRLVTWLMRLGNAVSSQRCVVLSGGDQGWCVWEIVHQELTLELLLHQTLGRELPTKDAVQILTRAATDFVAASQEFAIGEVELPIHFHTLAHENGATVYSTFLPHAPLAASGRDALAELATELRSFLQTDRLGALNVTEALRELERLGAARPQILPAVEVLQSLLIGE